jgi:hypothetical protein
MYSTVHAFRIALPTIDFFGRSLAYFFGFKVDRIKQSLVFFSDIQSIHQSLPSFRREET